MRDADRDRTARVGLQLDPAAVEVQHRVPGEDVERALVRVEVRVDVAVLEHDERESGVCRAGHAADQHHPRQAFVVLGQPGLELDVLPPDEPVARHTGVSVAASRSAPRTYVLPATSSSSAGKRVRMRLPAAVTTTSSSIRAAERPSLAAQYVSSAKTMPSSISIGQSNECTREIIGGSYRPTPTPCPNCSPKHASSLGKPSSSAVGQAAVTSWVVVPGLPRSIEAPSHSRHCLYASSCDCEMPPTLKVR